MSRILFILKARENIYKCDPMTDSYSDPVGPDPTDPTRKVGPDGPTGFLSSGLFNSARFVSDMLIAEGHVSAVEHAVDNDCIDRLVTLHTPDVVIIEAYWVVPEKFEVLTRLHPTVRWIIRNHSATPFAATEGIIMDWSLRYMDYPNVSVSCNDPRTNMEFRALIATRHPHWGDAVLDHRCPLLPNFYPVKFKGRVWSQHPNVVDIACFGAVRPLKNHLIQAIAAIRYANEVGKRLRFHINATRVEGRGEPILHNIEKMFAQLPQHELICHNWMSHDDFIALCATMDIGLQVSYTETFNIVAADMVMNDVPVVTSAEIKWVHPLYHADPNDSDSILAAIKRALRTNRLVRWWSPNIGRLSAYNADSTLRWLDMLKA